MSNVAQVINVDDDVDGDDDVEHISTVPRASELSNKLQLALECIQGAQQGVIAFNDSPIPSEHRQLIFTLKQQIDELYYCVDPTSRPSVEASTSASQSHRSDGNAPLRLTSGPGNRDGQAARPLGGRGKRKRQAEVDRYSDDGVEDLTGQSTAQRPKYGSGGTESAGACSLAASAVKPPSSIARDGQNDNSDILACAICAGQASDVIRQDELQGILSACSSNPRLHGFIQASFSELHPAPASSSSSSSASFAFVMADSSGTGPRTRSLACLETCSHFVCNVCMTVASVRCGVEGRSSVACPVPAPTSSFSSSSSSSSSSSTAAQACGCTIQEVEYKDCLTQLLRSSDAVQGVLDALQQASVAAATKDLTMARCPACGFTCEKIQAGQGGTGAGGGGMLKDEDGNVLSKAAAEHVQQYRLRCPTPACGVNFCTGCQSQPYHLGYTCEQKKEHAEAIKCTYCDVVIHGLESGWQSRKAALLKEAAKARGKKGAGGATAEALERQAFLLSVCKTAECQGYAEHACGVLLPCGHACAGVKGESAGEHLCLQAGCASAAGNGGDFCTVCYSVGLSAAPCCKLSCGHVLHYHCAQSVLRAGYPGNRITFGHLNCQLCKVKPMSHSALEQDMKGWAELKAKVQGQARDRLQMEYPDDSSRAREPMLAVGGRYHGQPEAFAMDKFAFYPCFKCKEPYFAGARVCGEANAENGGSAQDRLCSSCLVPPPGIKSCAVLDSQRKKHGIRYLDYKCRFCCSPAQFFCFGTTHFCLSCHEAWMANPGKIAVQQCPLEAGSGACPLLGRVRHAPNGKGVEAEYSLGCAQCRLEAILKG